MSGSAVEEAVRIILQADLAPIEHEILLDFIQQATNPEKAADEVLKRVNNNTDQSVEAALRGFEDDWHRLVATVARSVPDTPPTPTLRELLHRRDRSRCCVTPATRKQRTTPEPILIIPRSVLHMVESNDVSRELLEAFMSRPGVSQLRRMAADTSDVGMLANTWLLSPGLSDAFRSGHLQVRPRGGLKWREFDHVAAENNPTKAKYLVMRLYPEPHDDVHQSDGSLFEDGACFLQTEDPKQLPLPRSFLLQTHCGLVNALHHFRVEERIAEGWPPPQRSLFLRDSFRLMLRRLWLILPRPIRHAAYRRLLKTGTSKYGQDISFAVQQLSMGLYTKRIDRSGDNELQALRLLERQAPSIPAPRVIDTFQIPTPDGTDTWFIMTALPGARVHDVLHRMSYAERDQLADHLRGILDQMHNIPNRTPYLFTNVSGGPIYDRRAAAPGGCGPYKTEAELNAQLAKGVERYLRQDHPTAFSRSHQTVFTHSDLFLANVLVDGGRLSGIVDWENAGFMPEYWDFTKAMRVSGLDKGAQAIYRRIWGHQYDEELQVERWLWRVFPFGGPEA